MKITRKEFIHWCSASALVALSQKLVGRLRGASPTSGGRTRPKRTGKQYGMVIDTRKCLERPGCTKCMDACHEAHNVPTIPGSAHSIDWNRKTPFPNVFASYECPYVELTMKNQPALVQCNHCDDPPCVHVCPTGATWKRKEDGIVMMDWHRCIGCKYCIVACPYGARSFNFLDPRPYIKHPNPDFPTRCEGVVEKCNFCVERLAQGKSPACCDVCPVEALVFGDVNDPASSISKILRSGLTLRRKPELGTGPNIYYIV